MVGSAPKKITRECVQKRGKVDQGVRRAGQKALEPVDAPLNVDRAVL